MRPILLATAFALAGCGGDGGSGGVASTPPPPVTPPTSITAIIPAAATSQQFEVMGATQTDAAGSPPLLNASDQLQVRYVASSGSYEVQLSGSEWAKVSYDSTGTGSFLAACGCGADNVWLKAGEYQYSRLLSWFDGASYGNEAVGMATPAGGVPVAGSATYSGQILGQTSESHPDGSALPLDGSVALSFNFGAGSLSGSVTPNLHQGYDLGTIDFRNTVYSTGSTTFSGKFDTSFAGVNSFSGLFTGPNAQELIGNFAFPYRSQIDDMIYQADGAFVGAK
jgi:hypothetical protein